MADLKVRRFKKGNDHRAKRWITSGSGPFLSRERDIVFPYGVGVDRSLLVFANHGLGSESRLFYTLLDLFLTVNSPNLHLKCLYALICNKWSRGGKGGCHQGLPICFSSVQHQNFGTNSLSSSSSLVLCQLLTER